MDSYAVWAPFAEDVELVFPDEQRFPLRREGEWFTSDLTPVIGQRYGFAVRKEGQWQGPFPDPRSTAQPEGVHGFSEVTSSDFAWSAQWSGRFLAGQVLYELHVGTFSEAGTFAGVIEKLDYLQELGVSAIELMPVQPFGGERNWGYDGVSWYAVQESYGGREGLKELVDAAHAHGIAVVLDVVYNHFGPDGNYTGVYGPYTAGGSTGWGEVINLNGPGSDEVRAFILGAVRQWLEEFRIDGLRLDAVHAFDDRGAYSLMEQIQEVADDVAARTGVPRFVIAESDLNDPRLISSPEAGGYGLAGQWVDDIHHALHTVVSGEDHAYYADFGSLAALAKTLREGFYFTGTFSSFRGRKHGRGINRELIPAHRMVTYTTTHDQTGNRAGGDRPSMNLSPEQQVLKAAVILCSPYTPMLFMGEEFGAQTPFPFFCSHTDPALNEATRQGRRREFARSGWAPEEIVDPADPDTFAASRLRWEFEGAQEEILAAYRRLLQLRRDLGLARADLRQLKVEFEEGSWLKFGYPDVELVANFNAEPVQLSCGGEVLYSFRDGARLDGAQLTLEPWGFAVVRKQA